MALSAGTHHPKEPQMLYWALPGCRQQCAPTENLHRLVKGGLENDVWHVDISVCFQEKTCTTFHSHVRYGFGNKRPNRIENFMFSQVLLSYLLVTTKGLRVTID